MALRQQVRVLAIDLLVWNDEVATSIGCTHANVVSEVDHKVSEVSDIVHIRLVARLFVFLLVSLCPLKSQVREYDLWWSSASGLSSASPTVFVTYIWIQGVAPYQGRQSLVCQGQSV
jgi:hypothetical protein